MRPSPRSSRRLRYPQSTSFLLAWSWAILNPGIPEFVSIWSLGAITCTTVDSFSSDTTKMSHNSSPSKRIFTAREFYLQLTVVTLSSSACTTLVVTYLLRLSFPCSTTGFLLNICIWIGFMFHPDSVSHSYLNSAAWTSQLNWNKRFCFGFFGVRIKYQPVTTALRIKVLNVVIYLKYQLLTSTQVVVNLSSLMFSI